MWLARAGTFLASAIGVIGGIGTGTAWLETNVSHRAAHLAALITLIVTAGIVQLLALPRRGNRRRGSPPATTEITRHGRWPLAGHYKLWHYWLYIGVLALAMVINAQLVSPSTSNGLGDYVTAYLYVSLAAFPIFWLLYQLDMQNHRECPMCCERIKSRAHICRYCGSQMPD